MYRRRVSKCQIVWWLALLALLLQLQLPRKHQGVDSCPFTSSAHNIPVFYLFNASYFKEFWGRNKSFALLTRPSSLLHVYFCRIVDISFYVTFILFQNKLMVLWKESSTSIIDVFHCFERASSQSNGCL